MEEDSRFPLATQLDGLSLQAEQHMQYGDCASAHHLYRQQEALLAAHQSKASSRSLVLTLQPSATAEMSRFLSQQARKCAMSLIHLIPAPNDVQVLLPEKAPVLDSFIAALPPLSEFDTIRPTAPQEIALPNQTPKTQQQTAAVPQRPLGTQRAPVSDQKQSKAASVINSTVYRNKLMQNRPYKPPGSSNGTAKGSNSFDNDEEEDIPVPAQNPTAGFKTAGKVYIDDLAKKDPAAAAAAEKAAAARRQQQQNDSDLPAAKRRKVDDESDAKAEIEDRPEYKGLDPEIVLRIENEILDSELNVKFADIAGLNEVKRTLFEMIIYPNQHPDLFTGLRAPPRGLLLFGPPGNGKTLIAKAVASEAGMTFFSVSAASLTSKWIGEGEKTVRALFAVAKVKQPSFIFIDEIDSILSSRSAEEHESTRRLKNEFLIQFGGALDSPDQRVTVMGATNRPQDLDEAARRRLPKRVYVPLPEFETRRHLLGLMLAKEDTSLGPKELDTIAEMTDGYSCADISQVCREAAMKALREINLADAQGQRLDKSVVRPMNMKDFTEAIREVKPSVSKSECQIYEQFNSQFSTVSNK